MNVEAKEAKKKKKKDEKKALNRVFTNSNRFLKEIYSN
jgi:hypothetical protein